MSASHLLAVRKLNFQPVQNTVEFPSNAVPSVLQIAIAERVLDGFNSAMMIVDEDGEVLAANRVARVRICIDESADTPSARMPFSDGKSRELWRNTIQSLSNFGSTTVSLSLNGRDHTVSIYAAGDLVALRGTFIVAIATPLSLSRSIIAHLAARYRLTRSECEVVGALCSGLPPKKIASRRQVSIATIRTQIRSILEKTNSPSVSGLIILIASYPPTMQDGPSCNLPSSPSCNSFRPFQPATSSKIQASTRSG